MADDEICRLDLVRAALKGVGSTDEETASVLNLIQSKCGKCEEFQEWNCPLKLDESLLLAHLLEDNDQHECREVLRAVKAGLIARFGITDEDLPLGITI